MIRALLDWLLGRPPLGYIEHWTPDRAKVYEREMHTRLGRVVEPRYTWHAQLLKAKRRKVKPSKVLRPAFRKRA